MRENVKRKKISRENLAYELAVARCAPTSPFRYSLSLSLALFARVFLFSLTPVYFFLLSSARAYVTAGRFIETLVTRFQVPRSWLGTSRGYPIRFTRSFRSPPSFSLRPLSMTRNRRSLDIHHLSFALPGRSILLHFSRDRFFSPPWSCCTRLLLPCPLSFSLGKVPLLSLFFTPLSSSVIRPSRGSCRPVSSSPLRQLSSIFRDVFSPPRRRWQRARKSFFAHCIAQDIYIFPQS